MPPGFSLAQYVPQVGPLPGAHTLTSALDSIVKNREAEQVRKSEEMRARAELAAHAERDRLKREFDAQQAKLLATAQVEKEQRERQGKVRENLRTARLGLSPMGIDVLGPEATAAGMNISEVPAPPPGGEGGMRMNPATGELERFGPEPDLDAELARANMGIGNAVGQEEARAAGARVITEPGGEQTVYDPRQVAAGNEQLGQARVEALGPEGKAPNRFEALRESEYRKALVQASAAGIHDPVKAAEFAEKRANEAAAQETSRENAKFKQFSFNVGEGRRERVEERTDIGAFEKANEPVKTRQAIRGLEMAAKSIADNNGVLTGAAQTQMATMFQGGVLSNQDFTRTVEGKAGILATIYSKLTSLEGGDLSEPEKVVLSQAIVRLGQIKREQLFAAREEFLKLKEYADPDTRPLYDKYERIWFGTGKPSTARQPGGGGGAGFGASAGGSSVNDLDDIVKKYGKK